MFEEELFKDIAANFKLADTYFGEAPSKAKAPYIIQYSLDSNGTRGVLCNTDDFTDGEAFIQWNIYATNASNAFYLKQELMKYIASLDVLTNYRILLNNHSSSPSGTDINTGLFLEVVSREMTYTKRSI